METKPIGSHQGMYDVPLASEEKRLIQTMNRSSLHCPYKCPGSVITKVGSFLGTLFSLCGFGEKGALRKLINDPARFLNLLDPTSRPLGKYECIDGFIARVPFKDINVSNNEGKTILFLLCEKEGEILILENGKQIVITTEIIQQVLEKGGNWNHPNNLRQYPMHVVKSVQTAEALANAKEPLANRNDISCILHAGDVSGRTPLHTASMAGRSELMAWMLRQLSNPNHALCKDIADVTPLHYAANVETARTIVNFNRESLLQKDILQECPHQSASRKGRVAVESFLIQEMTKEQ